MIQTIGGGGSVGGGDDGDGDGDGDVYMGILNASVRRRKCKGLLGG